MTELNRVILIGRLTRDPEKSYTTSGTAVTKFGFATSNGFGENKRPVFVDITAWGKVAEFVSTYFSKGKEILIEGRLEFDTWESKEGEKRSKLYVTAEQVSFVGSNPAGAKSDNSGRAFAAGEAGKVDNSGESEMDRQTAKPTNKNTSPRPTAKPAEEEKHSAPSFVDDNDIPF